jgi:prepilin-type N-terminal cleavage/methylation domain-containing protein
MSPRSESGLSLVEILVVIALIAIVSSFSTYIMDTYRRAVISKIRDDVLSTLERARTLSITSVPHGMSCLGNQFALVGLKDGRCRANANTPCYDDSDCGSGDQCDPGDYIKASNENDTKVLEVHTLPASYSICCIGSCANYVVWFDRKGVPRDASWGLGMTTVRINHINKDGSSTEVSTITVSPSGRIQYEK